MIVSIGELAVGSIVVDSDTTYRGKPIEWIVANRSYGETYFVDGSIQLISKDILLMNIFDSRENLQKRLLSGLGGFDYGYSFLNRWLNTDGDCIWDNIDPPNKGIKGINYSIYERGFLTGFSSTMKEKIVPSRVPYRALDASGEFVIRWKLDDVFVPSLGELGLKPNYEKTKAFEYFRKKKHLKTRVTDDIAKERELSEDEIDNCFYWTRSIYDGVGLLYVVFKNMISNLRTSSRIGCRPVISVDSSLLIDTKQINGTYKIIKL